LRIITKATPFFLKALNIADSLKMNQYIKELYRNLAENALLKGDIVKNDEYFKKEIEYEALLVDEKINDKIANFEVKYNTLEKEREIDKQRLTIEKQEANRKRQLYFQNFLITGAILLLVLMFVLYRSYKSKKKSNVTILEKNALLIEANEEIRAQSDEIQTQRDLVVSQKDFIEIQKDRLDDSIHYAQRIQNAVLHANDCLNTFFSNSFIIFRPKDVVSGDFYWTTKIEDKIIVAVADCTGHGVPGAFMSMLGISYLNEIVHRKDMNDTNQILEEMRKSIIQALNQKFDSHSQRDSLELGILSFNVSSGEGQWSSAGIPLWISRKNSETNNQQLEEIPYDAMPVGIYHKMNPFTSQQVSIT
jgi:serine phosphatase RsbU (regulator of sigma subunit)